MSIRCQTKLEVKVLSDPFFGSCRLQFNNIKDRDKANKGIRFHHGLTAWFLRFFGGIIDVEDSKGKVYHLNRGDLAKYMQAEGHFLDINLDHLFVEIKNEEHRRKFVACLQQCPHDSQYLSKLLAKCELESMIKQDFEGNNLLHLAVKYLPDQTLEALLDQFSKECYLEKNKVERTPLSEFFDKIPQNSLSSKEALIDKFISNTGQKEGLHNAISSLDSKKVISILDYFQKKSCHQTNTNGEAALHLAIKKYELKAKDKSLLLSKLIEKGDNAALHLNDKWNNTPLLSAVKRLPAQELHDFLLNFPLIDAYRPTCVEDSPIYFLLKRGFLSDELVQLLDCFPREYFWGKNDDGQTLLHYALRLSYDAKVYAAMIQKWDGALQEADKSGDFPQHIAAKHCSSAVFKTLLPHLPADGLLALNKNKMSAADIIYDFRKGSDALTALIEAKPEALTTPSKLDQKLFDRILNSNDHAAIQALVEVKSLYVDDSQAYRLLEYGIINKNVQAMAQAKKLLKISENYDPLDPNISCPYLPIRLSSSASNHLVNSIKRSWQDAVQSGDFDAQKALLAYAKDVHNLSCHNDGSRLLHKLMEPMIKNQWNSAVLRGDKFSMDRMLMLFQPNLGITVDKDGSHYSKRVPQTQLNDLDLIKGILEAGADPYLRHINFEPKEKYQEEKSFLEELGNAFNAIFEPNSENAERPYSPYDWAPIECLMEFHPEFRGSISHLSAASEDLENALKNHFK